MELIEYSDDPMTGMRTVHRLDHDGRMFTTYQQDLEGVLEYTKAMRNDEDVWKQGVKNSMVHIATIPDVVVLELRKLGINVYRAPVKDIVQGLHKLNKPHLLTTTKNVF